jgi:hypothetical protein
MTQMIPDPDNDGDVDLPGGPDPDNDTGDFEERKNTGRVVVALPAATEPIHHLGDVDEPKHLTMVWLGKPEENPGLDMDQINDAVRDVAGQHDGPITGEVSGTGQLGDQDAQVVFLHGDDVHACHDKLLGHPAIAPAVDAVEQHPGFTPHTTLGYGPADPANNNDLDGMDQIVYDRLGVWNGDEHTEYPLGPSASSEETTEPVDETTPLQPGIQSGDELYDELVASMARHIDDPLVVNNAATLATACNQADALADESSQMATRRVLMRRARSLGCQHVIPQVWLRQAAQAAQVTQTAQADVTAVMAPDATGVPDPFQLKTQLSTLPDTALRAAYMRGVREYAMTAPQSRPPLSRDVIAQARVNSLIRLAQGDLSARTDDRDLLP